MAAMFHKDKVDEPKSPSHSEGWYADPYGEGARRWYDETAGWTDRVEGVGEDADKTGLARIDDAADSSSDSTEQADADGEPARLSRPVDADALGQA